MSWYVCDLQHKERWLYPFKDLRSESEHMLEKPPVYIHFIYLGNRNFTNFLRQAGYSVFFFHIRHFFIAFFFVQIILFFISHVLKFGYLP